MGLGHLGRRLSRLVRTELHSLEQKVRTYMRDRGSASGKGGPAAAASDATDGSPYHERIVKYYANLELPPGAGVEEVKRAYRRLVSRYHPDRHARDQSKQAAANEVARCLREAYEALLAHLEEDRDCST